MMRPVFAVAAAVSALIASAGQARGIDCAKAASRLERLICGDPVMLDYDNRIAAAYARAMAAWNGGIADYVRRDQQQWLTGFLAMERLDAATETDCTLSDSECVRAEMRRRVDDIESGSYVHSGVYRATNGMKLLLHPALANGYKLRLFDPAHGERSVVTLDEDRVALWDGPTAMVAKMGDANGLPLPAGDGCTLRLAPDALAIRVVQQGGCQGQRFEGVYQRQLGETLRSYELELY